MATNRHYLAWWGALIVSAAILSPQLGLADGPRSIFDDPALLPPAPATAPATSAKPSPGPSTPVTPSTPTPPPSRTPTPADTSVHKPAPPPALPAPDSPTVLGKLAVPETAARSKITTVVKQIYIREYAEKTPAGKRSLGRELLLQADRIQSNFAARYVLLEEAESAAISGADAETCRKAIEGIEQTFNADTTMLTLSALTSLADAGGDAGAVSTWAADCVEARIAQGNYKAARQITRTLSSRAARHDDPALREKLKSLDVVLAEAERVRPSLEKLKTTPNDPPANLAAGRFYCFYRHDWSTGLPMLGKGPDSQLAEAAKNDLANPTDPVARYQLAGQWWELAKEHVYASIQASLRERAGYWYQQAEPEITGLQKALAAKRIAQVADDQVAHSDVRRELIFESYIDGNTEIHLTPKGIYLKELGVSKPGRNDGHDDPTYLNGQIWKLAWKNPNTTRGRDETEILPMNLGKLNFDFEVTAIGQERGKPGKENRTPPSMRDEGGEQIIWVPDPESGARWYTIRIFRK